MSSNYSPTAPSDSATATAAAASSGAFLQSFLGLQGKVALVTGSTSGLGRAMAVTLCAAGCHVVVNGARDPERTARAARDIAAHCHVDDVGGGDDATVDPTTSFPRVLAAHGDASKPEQAAAVVEAIRSTFDGRLDILVNNAGINLPEDIFEIQYNHESWQKLNAVNLEGPMNMTQAALPLLKSSTSPRIINVSSMIGHAGSPTNTLYTMTKAAIQLFTKSLAAQLANEPGTKNGNVITVNSVSPGIFDTDMNAKFTLGPEESLKAVENGIPMRRLGKPQEVTGAVLYLASEAASYTTGTDIVVDGGYLAV